VTTTEPGQPTTATVTIDGKQFAAKPGELLIKVAQEHGVFIPRFCWHERMKPVGMCRMCLVEVEGARGYPPACTTPVTDGMVCHTTTDAVKRIQDGMLEFLLINHPLDCPVCDRGGECPLQDQTLAFGPGESRFVEEKRHWEKPIPLSNLILLDRERCIQCARCTRFAEEIAGDPLIDFVDRSEFTQVLNFAEQPFDSYFSGNTVQICPVGALTATQYRFRARPWDLSTAETSCTACAVHCRGAVQSSSNRLVRLLGVDLDPVNHGWLCDKGRYGIEWVHSEHRVLEPRVRRDGELVDVSWPEALDAAAGEVRRVLDQHGPSAIAVLGGAHGTNEDAYVWARLAKSVFGTDNVDAQMGDGLPADVVLGLPRAEIGDCDRAAAVVLLGPDLREELPVLFLRIKRAAKELGVPLVDLAPIDHGLTEYATHVARHLPGTAIGAEALDLITQARDGRPGPVVVVLGRSSLAEAADATVQSAATLAARNDDVLFLSALRRANVHGALGAGLAPGFLPGQVGFDDARDWYTEHWGSLPAERGLDTAGVLEAAASGRVHVLVLLGADPICDFPDAELARRGIDGAAFVIAVDAFISPSTKRADVFLPCTLWGEKSGTVTNLEHRVQRLGRKVAPEGTAMDDWRIASELAYRLGRDFDLATVDEVADEMARVAPAQLGATAALLRRVRDGVVLPLRDHLGELVVRTRELSILADDGSGTSWDPIKVEGVAPADSTNVAAATGTGSTTNLTPGAGDPGDDPAEAAEAVETAHAASGEPAANAPALYAWDGELPERNPPAPDAYALRLVVGRKLYDKGRIVSETPVFAPLGPDRALRVNPHDLAALGVEAGTLVRITGVRGALEHPVVSDAAVPAGVAFMPFLADGTGAATLIDTGSLVTDVRVETLR
jgi:NADH-quinone oxidoreductase subunit G